MENAIERRPNLRFNRLSSAHNVLLCAQPPPYPCCNRGRLIGKKCQSRTKLLYIDLISSELPPRVLSRPGLAPLPLHDRPPRHPLRRLRQQPTTMKKQTKFLLLLAAAVFLSSTAKTSAITYTVVPDAASTSTSPEVYSLSEAVELAVAGDIVSMADGIYTDQIQSYVAGEEGNPIKIIGGRGAVIKASSPSVRIEHSWITLEVRRLTAQQPRTRYKQKYQE